MDNIKHILSPFILRRASFLGFIRCYQFRLILSSTLLLKPQYIVFQVLSHFRELSFFLPNSFFKIAYLTCQRFLSVFEFVIVLG